MPAKIRTAQARSKTDRRNRIQGQGESLPANVNPLSYRQPGSMKRKKCK